MLRSFLPGCSIKQIVMSTCAENLFVPATGPTVQALAGDRKIDFLLPSRAIDTHVHIFDPSGHPYAATRSYSPSAAVLSELLDFTSRFTRNGLPSTVVLVQPSPYGTDNRLLCQSLQMCHRQGLPLARGIAVIDPDTTPDGELQQLHQCGVRGVRIVCRRYGAPR
jgi:predicted TIM-barrel fold metal-dependent hydrolase